MAEENRYAVAAMTLGGRGQVVRARPVGRVLAVTVRGVQAQSTEPKVVEDEIPEQDVSGEEVKLARTLVEGSTAKDFDFARYQDEYTGRVQELIERKAAGKKIIAVRKEQEPAVINLMDALRQSLAAAKHNGKGHAGRGRGKPHKAPARRKTG